MDKRDIITAYAAEDNVHQNMEMKRFAKEILLEENYVKFIKSYKFTFWSQLLGVLAGFLLPCIVLIIVTREVEYLIFGAPIGIFWMCIWLPITLVLPQTRIYRKFAKWFRKRHATLDELKEIF